MAKQQQDRGRKPRQPSEVDRDTIGQEQGGYTPSSITGQESDFDGETAGTNWTPQEGTEEAQDDTDAKKRNK